MKRKKWLLLILVAVLATVVVACGAQPAVDTAQLEAANKAAAEAEAKAAEAETMLATAEAKAAAAVEAGAEELAAAEEAAAAAKAEAEAAMNEAEAAKAEAEAAMQETVSETEDATGPITLRVWSPQDQWQESLEYYAENLKDFEEKYPNVTIEYVHIPYEGYEAKYLTAFAGQAEAPDIFMGKPAYYAGAIGVADVAPDDLQELYTESLIEVTQPFFQVDGKWVAYPVSSDLGMQLYYNVDHFEEVGLDPNDPPQTFEELMEYAEKLTVYDDNGNILRNGMAHRYDGAPVGLADKALPYIHAFGGRLYAPDGSTAEGYLNGPETVAALQYMADMVYNNKVASLELGKPVDTFAAGKSSMIFREGWLVGWMADNAPDVNYAVAPLPEGPGGYPGLSLLFGWSWMVNKFSPHADIAWDWVRAVSNEKTDLELAKLEGYHPVWQVNFDDPFVADRPDYVATQAILSHPTGPYYDDPFINEIATRVGEAVQAVLFGEAEPQEALDAAVADVDALLAKEP